MNTPTLKSSKGKFIVTVNGKEETFGMMILALEYIYEFHSRRARTSIT